MSSGYTLIIKPKRGEFLKNYDTFGKMDPFIKVTLGKAVQKSDVATKQGKTPEWKKVLTFDLTQAQYDNLENLTLLFEAFDEDLTSDDWIGKLSVKLSQLKLTPGEINKLTLTDNKSVVVGDIYVEVEFRHGPSTPSNQHAPLDKSSPQKPGTQSHAQTNSQANAQPNRAQTGGNAPGPAYALIVKPKRGKFLKDYDAIGKMDPFIRVTFGKEVQTSDIAQGQGKTPEWKKVLTFALTQAQYESYENFSILFEAFDEDVTTHDYIGKHLAKLPQLKLKAGEINTLTLVDNKSVAVGTIDVEVELRNNVGAPAPSFGARHPIGTIAVKPVSGRFESLNDYQELYLVFIHGEVGFRSGNSEGPARKPSFRDIITFPHFENEEMTVRVFDSDPSRNEMIGEGHINIAKLHRHGFVPGHVIYISNAYQKAVGELSVDFEFIQEAFNHPVKVYPAVNIRKGEYATKKLKYSNPDKVKKNLRVRSENKDIILVSTEALTLPPGGTGELRFKFWAPHGRNPEEKCKIDIIDEDNRVIEETLLFKIKAI